MSAFLEVAMLILFGCSWPVSIRKSWKSRTTKGKSLLFLVLLDLGYACGIAGKFTSDNVTYVVAFYILNFVMVLVDICLYFRNRVLDRQRDRMATKEKAQLAADTPYSGV